MSRSICIALGAVAMCLSPLPCAAEKVPLLSHREVIPFSGEVTDSKNLSGIAQINGYFAVCADEVAQFNLLKMDGGRFKVFETVALSDDDVEVDMEGMTAEGSSLYIVGSHSLARKATDVEKTYKKNRERILKVSEDEARDQLFRLNIGENGKIKSKKRIRLHKMLRNDPLLGRFVAIPSKENGLDIEGIAIKDSKLHIGFRGPVLRGNYVPMLVFEFDDPDEYEILFVNLNGQGVRDLTAVNDGFLILAGPVGDAADGSFVYLWNGLDCLVGSDSPGGTCTLLAELEPPKDGKAEGLVVNETANEYELLVVFDGVADGVFRFLLPK